VILLKKLVIESLTPAWSAPENLDMIDKCK
jgi:hypothetical protein